MKRSAFITMIDTTPAGESRTYELIGDGVTDLSISYNPQTKTEQFINQDSADTTVTGYQPNAPVTQQAKKGNPVFEFVNALRKSRAIGEDAETTIVTVDAFEDGVDGAYPAEQQKVSVQIDSFGGPASDPLSIGYTLNYKGDAIPGTFNPKTKEFVAAATE
ncbi:MAG: hypothetical protein E7293_03395 [Lachnospiraceae bacterium]|nr:hypothetical protein [Lachnospiraceae bacterium]